MCTCSKAQAPAHEPPPVYNVYMVATSNDHVNQMAAWVQKFIVKFSGATGHEYNVKYRLIHKVLFINQNFKNVFYILNFYANVNP